MIAFFFGRAKLETVRPGNKEAPRPDRWLLEDPWGAFSAFRSRNRALLNPDKDVSRARGIRVLSWLGPGDCLQYAVPGHPSGASLPVRLHRVAAKGDPFIASHLNFSVRLMQ